MRDVLRTFFFDLLSGRDTHTKKRARGFRGDAFGGRLLFSSCLGERKREREMKMANWIDEKLHK